MLDFKVSLYNRQKITNVQQGVRRTDQNGLLDIFLSKTSSMTDLSDTSFLSSIDMDPNTSTHLAGQPLSPSVPSGFFGGFAMLANSSRDGSANPSRVGTPQIGHAPPGPKGVSFADGVKGGPPFDNPKFNFKRFGSLFGREQ